MRLQERELSFLVKGGWRWILGGVMGKILGRRVGGMARIVGVRWWGVMRGQRVLTEWGIWKVWSIRVELRMYGGQVLW